MAIEFTVILADQPGTLAELGHALGYARVNIDAIQGVSREGRSLVQFVPNDVEKAADALGRAGLRYTTREVVVVKVRDEPGTLGDVALVMADAGINIDSVYMTAGGHVVLGVDDLSGAIHVAAGMAVMVADD